MKRPDRWGAVLVLCATILVAGCNSGASESSRVASAPATAEASASATTAIPSPAPPTFDLAPGAYAGDVRLGVTSEDGAEIWFTLDGSEPAPGRSDRYQGPVPLHGDVTVRAVAALPDGTPSDETAARYRVFAERIDLDEPIILVGDDVREFTDALVYHRGPIDLSGDARLVLRDALLVHDKDYAFQYELVAHDRATVVVEDSAVGTTCNGSFNWAFFDDAGLEARHVDPTYAGCNTWAFMSGRSRINVDGWDTFSGTVCDGAQVEVHRSKTLELEFCLSSGVTIDTTLPAVIDDFTFDREDDPGAAYSLHVTESEVDGWGVNMVPGTDLTIRDGGAVTIAIIAGLPWDGLTVEVDGLRSGRYEDQTWLVGDSRLRLVNTEVYGWEPNAFHTNTIVIRNSDYSGSAVNGGQAHYEIVDSRAGQLVAAERVTMTVRNSVITGDVVANDDAEIVLIDCMVEGSPAADGARTTGNVIARGNGRVVLRNTEVLGEIVMEDQGQVIEE